MKPPTWLAAPLYLWSLPNALLGLVLALWAGPIGWKWHQGALVITVQRVPGGEWINGQTHSWVVLVEEDKASVRVHEFVHVKQRLVLGPLFLPLYGGNYLINRARGMSHADAYRAIWFEVVAYRVQKEFEEGKRSDAWGS
ncbi:hypothetical protein LCGC14_0374960 [marine sediment metagenome]|uniref:Uncharacterized protein n=1 Tax=marine sediment metagenome TaxID=412755 RepID=A0A0F9T9T4_9ZZZZ